MGTAAGTQTTSGTGRTGSAGTVVPGPVAPVTVAPGPGPVPGPGPGPVAGPVVVEADPGETELAARLRLAVTRLHRRLREHGVGGLTQSQASALASIDLLGSPTLGKLAERESVQPPSMTKIVAGLEQLDLVERATDPNDRRVTRVRLTSGGRRTLGENRSRKNAYLAGQIHGLDAGDRAALRHLTELLERLGDAEAP